MTSRTLSPKLRTFLTAVVGLEVEFEVGEARLQLVEVLVRSNDLAVSPTGTACVGQVDDVSTAADVSDVVANTSAELHASVQRHLHDDDFVGTARRLERLPVAEVLHTCNRNRQRLRICAE